MSDILNSYRKSNHNNITELIEGVDESKIIGQNKHGEDIGQMSPEVTAKILKWLKECPDAWDYIFDYRNIWIDTNGNQFGQFILKDIKYGDDPKDSVVILSAVYKRHTDYDLHISDEKIYIIWPKKGNKYSK